MDQDDLHVWTIYGSLTSYVNSYQLNLWLRQDIPGIHLICSIVRVLSAATKNHTRTHTHHVFTQRNFKARGPCLPLRRQALRGKKPQLEIPELGATVSAICDVTGKIEARDVD